MKLIIKIDSESQAKYLCFLAKNIQSETYQKTNLPILPYPTKSDCVFFPDLNFSGEFWSLIKKSKSLHLSGIRSVQLVGISEKYISDLINLNDINKKEKILKDYWRQNYVKFFTLSKMIFNKDFSKGIKEIEILITPFGTSGSFKNEGPRVIMTTRTDLPNDSIFQTLLNALIRRKLNHLTETGTTRFIDRQKYLTFLLRHTAFSKIISTHTHSESEKITTDSNIFLTKLGFPTDTTLQINDQKIVINSSDVSHIFTKYETTLLKKLYEKFGKVVSFEEVAEAVWKDKLDEKFSLYSLAKIVEKIRKKLEDLGIQKEILKTARGKGYMLN